ncbi:5' nucleotidase, NT5C type [Haloferacaceae archaeon DSL9]
MTIDLVDETGYDILLDVDGTLCSNGPRIADYAAEEYGVSITPEEITAWSYPVDGTDRHVGELIEDAITDRPEWFLLGMEPLAGAADAARWFAAQGHAVRIATHRPAASHPITRQWLTEHDIPFDELIQDVPRNKGALDGDLLVDDYHVNVQNALDAGMGGALFRQPYSDPSACDGAVVGDSWDALLASFGADA